MALPKILTAAVLALTLGATAMSAVPAQAASPSFSFQFGLGNGGVGMYPHPGSGVQLHFGDDNYFDYCMTNRQIARALSQYGFRDARVVREGNQYNKVIAVGRKGGSWYQMRVDRCTGKVDRVTKVRRSDRGDFSITLSF